MEYNQCNLRVTTQMYFCAYPLSMDLYSGCPHRCLYCFANNYQNFKRNGKSENDFFKTIIPCNTDKFFKILNEKQKYAKHEHVEYLINKRQPLHIGGMADPFPIGIEEKYEHAKKFLQQLEDYPIIISTKNPMYPELMEGKNIVLQCSIIGIGEQFRKIEPGVKSAEERIQALKQFKGKVKKIVIRMQPFIPWLYNKKSLEDFIRQVSEVADALTVEFLYSHCVKKNNLMDNVFGFNTCNKILENGKIMGTDIKFNDNYKIKYVDMIKKLCEKYGLEFYSAENSLRDSGCNCNCCGISKTDSEFQSFNKLNTSELLFKLKEKGKMPVKEYVNSLPDEYKNMSYLQNGTNSRNYKTYSQYKHTSIYDKFNESMHTNCPYNPCNIFRNITMKVIDGEMYFVYTGEKAEKLEV